MNSVPMPLVESPLARWSSVVGSGTFWFGFALAYSSVLILIVSTLWISVGNNVDSSVA